MAVQSSQSIKSASRRRPMLAIEPGPRSGRPRPSPGYTEVFLASGLWPVSAGAVSWAVPAGAPPACRAAAVLARGAPPRLRDFLATSPRYPFGAVERAPGCWSSRPGSGRRLREPRMTRPAPRAATVIGPPDLGRRAVTSVKHVRHGAEIADGYGPNRVPLRSGNACPGTRRVDV